MNTTSSVTRAAPRQPAQQPAHWHAHLSAIQRPPSAAVATNATAAKSPAPAPPAEGLAACPRAVVGVSLDKKLVGVPVHLRPKTAELLLSCQDRPAADGGGVDMRLQRWVIKAVAGSPGEYNVLVSCANDTWYLSAAAEGRAVELTASDDGSGRQRWVFREVSDELYSVRVVGGKADERVFLGIEDDASQVRMYAGEHSKTQWGIVASSSAPAPAPGGGAKPTPPATPDATPDADTRIPADVVPQLTGLTAMTEPQLDVVLQLISLPENGMPRWYKNYNYIEFLGDGRGFTATLFGACSGTGDLAMIFDELAKVRPRSAACDELLQYTDALKKKRGDDIKGIEPIKKIIRGLGDDPAWQQAVWKVYVKLYWQFAMNWADKKGESAKRPGPALTLPVTRGFMVDTAINHGADYGSFMDIVKRMPEAVRSSNEELVWFRAFADAREKMLRSGYQDLDTSKTGDRCRLWKALADGGNTGLKTPFQAYEGYWGKYTIA